MCRDKPAQTHRVLKKSNQYKAVGTACEPHFLLNHCSGLSSVLKCTREYTFGQVLKFYDNFIFIFVQASLKKHNKIRLMSHFLLSFILFF